MFYKFSLMKYRYEFLISYMSILNVTDIENTEVRVIRIVLLREILDH